MARRDKTWINWRGKNCFSHANLVNFWRPLQSLLLRYTAENSQVTKFCYALLECKPNISKAKCFQGYRSHHPPLALIFLQLSRVVSRCSPLNLEKARGGGRKFLNRKIPT